MVTRILDQSATPAELASASAAELPAPASPPADDLDSLLAEYESANGPAQQPATQPDQDGPVRYGISDDELERRLETIQINERLKTEATEFEAKVAAFQEQKNREDFSNLAKSVRGDMDPVVFDEAMVQGWIDAVAIKDSALQQAWANRETDPHAWRSAAQHLSREFVKTFKKLPDANATEDRNLVAAAVRGASTQAPADQPLNFNGMDNAAYRKSIRDEFGFDPGV